MIDKKLILLLVISVSFMVYLKVEGFAQYQSNKDRMRAIYGLGGGASGSMKTASDFPNEAAYKAAQEWEASNFSGSNIQDLYTKLRKGLLTTSDIRDRIGTGDKGKTPNKSWLTFYDATDYDESGPDFVRTASGNFYNKRTGSRLNETTYIDTQYFNEDAVGGRTLTQCDSGNFECIRNLSYSDPNYQPTLGDPSWDMQFGGAQQPQQQQQQQQQQSIPPNAGNRDIASCLVDCLNRYGRGNATDGNIASCVTLCTNSSTA
jgi:hypothetical protein